MANEKELLNSEVQTTETEVVKPVQGSSFMNKMKQAAAKVATVSKFKNIEEQSLLFTAKPVVTSKNAFISFTFVDENANRLFEVDFVLSPGKMGDVFPVNPVLKTVDGREVFRGVFSVGETTGNIDKESEALLEAMGRPVIPGEYVLLSASFAAQSTIPVERRFGKRFSLENQASAQASQLTARSKRIQDYQLGRKIEDTFLHDGSF